jgi:hypothetical protein
MHWVSRAVLAWRLSDTTDGSFCIAALEEALTYFGHPDIFNTDQGSQFTGAAFTGALAAAGVRVSMDGRSRWMDTSSSSGCGARSSTRTSTSRAMPTAARRTRVSHHGCLLQHWAPAPDARQPHADDGLARRRARRARRGGCGHDGQRKSAPHMPTAATADVRYDRMIEAERRRRPSIRLPRPLAGATDGVHFRSPTSGEPRSRRSARTGPSAAKTSPSIRSATFTSARPARFWLPPAN